MHRRSARLSSSLAAAVIGAFVGCRAGLVREPGPTRVVPAVADAAARPVPRTLSLEVAFVRYDDQDSVLHEDLWNFVDEQALGPEARRRLNANGLRAGVVVGTLPTPIADRMAAAAADDTAAIETGGARKLLRLLPGRRAEVVAATALPDLVVIEDGPDGVRGATYREATPQIAIEARPAADGGVCLEAVPEVKHGPVVRSWVGEEGLFRLEAGQRRHRLEHLEIAATLRPRSFLIVGCAGDATSTIGDALLRDRVGGGLRLLVLRPLEAAVDPLFASPPADLEPPD